VGFEDPDTFEPRILSKVYIEAVKNVALRIVDERGGAYYCGICGRGPYRRKGLYLHLKRVHGDDIIELVEIEAKRISSFSKRRGRV
jgi:hypothetical protein